MVIDPYKGNGTRDSVQILFSDVTIETFYCCYLDRKNLRRAKVISYVLRYWVSYTHNVDTVYLQRYKIYFLSFW